MDTRTKICFNVTPTQKETIDLRVEENGFDDIASYVKVVALKTEEFNLTPAGDDINDASVEICFEVTQTQKTKLDEKVTGSGCETLARYVQHVALHAVVGAVLEVRSTGNFDSMVERILAKKKKV